MLGIHPGFGGTVRAVRLAGVRTAMEMMLTGKTLRADKAMRAGFLDRLVFPADAEAAARELINAPAESSASRRCWIACCRGRWLRGLVTQAVLAQVRAKARREHYPAPYAIIDLWSKYGARGERPTKRKRVPSPTSCSARRRATWCACSCCRSA